MHPAFCFSPRIGRSDSRLKAPRQEIQQRPTERAAKTQQISPLTLLSHRNILPYILLSSSKRTVTGADIPRTSTFVLLDPRPCQVCLLPAQIRPRIGQPGLQDTSTKPFPQSRQNNRHRTPTSPWTGQVACDSQVLVGNLPPTSSLSESHPHPLQPRELSQTFDTKRRQTSTRRATFDQHRNNVPSRYHTRTIL